MPLRIVGHLRRRAIVWSILVIGALLLGSGFWLVDWIYENASSRVHPTVAWINPENIAESVRNWVWALSFLIGSIFAVVTLINGLRRTELIHQERRIEREGLNASTFAKAIELLDSDSVDRRVAAIYSLETLMRADFSDLSSDNHFAKRVGDSLAAFIQQKSILNESSDVVSPRLDVQVCLIALIRSWPVAQRPNINKEGGINLSNCNLSGITIPPESDLRSFNFSGSCLKEISFVGCNLSNANFSRTDFRKAFLREANFSDCELRDCDLSEALLAGSIWQRSSLNEVNFSQAYLDNAILTDASFEECVFSNAGIRHAELTGVTFSAFEADENGKGFPSREQLLSARWNPHSPPKFEEVLAIKRFVPPHDGTGKPIQPKDDSDT